MNTGVPAVGGECPFIMHSDTLLDLAGRFLHEAVFASREQGALRAPGDAAGCGLGRSAAIPDRFSPKQQDLIEQMLGASGARPHPPLFEAMTRETEAWIKLQDGLDRKRNHFLKDFRHEHGFDRKRYSPVVEAAFQEGIAALNAEQRERRDWHAAALAALFAPSADIAKRS